MLEWLKSILGEGYSEEIDTKVSDEIGKGFVARSDFNDVNEAKKVLEATVKERDGQLENLKKLDPEKMQAEIERLQGENETVAANAAKELAAAKLDFAIETRLIKEGAVNTKAVKALLDGSNFALAEDGSVTGLDDQLKTLKEKEKWAFAEQAAPEVPGDGANPAGAGDAPKEANKTYENGVATF